MDVHSDRDGRATLEVAYPCLPEGGPVTGLPKAGMYLSINLPYLYRPHLPFCLVFIVAMKARNYGKSPGMNNLTTQRMGSVPL